MLQVAILLIYNPGLLKDVYHGRPPKITNWKVGNQPIELACNTLNT